MQLRRDLLAATDRSETILHSLPTHFTGAAGETVPALVLLGLIGPDTGNNPLETTENALVLLEYLDRILEVTPPLIAGTLVRRLRADDEVRLTEKGRSLVVAARRLAKSQRQAVAS